MLLDVVEPSITRADCGSGFAALLLLAFSLSLSLRDIFEFSVPPPEPPPALLLEVFTVPVPVPISLSTPAAVLFVRELELTTVVDSSRNDITDRLIASWEYMKKMMFVLDKLLLLVIMR